jgi:hypothetical protein
MKQTDVTYSQLDQVLRSLGFSLRLKDGERPTRVYEHKETGAYITTPPYPMTDLVWDWHLVGARTTVDLFGIADPDTFDAEIRKAGRNGRRPARGKP